MLYLIISLITSTIGATCGIGGGIIIRPTLDILNLANAETASFLSGCAVLSMSAYSVANTVIRGKNQINYGQTTVLAVGACIGGIVGHRLFSLIKAVSGDIELVGRIQAFCLLVITAATCIFTIMKSHIKTRRITSRPISAVIGAALGMSSSFLGIGGGPINIAAFNYFFSMDAKTAAQNSLYVILFSQTASLLTTLVSRSVPVFSAWNLFNMVLGGILGGAIGKRLSARIDNRTVTKLFIGLMVVIIIISAVNAFGA